MKKYIALVLLSLLMLSGCGEKRVFTEDEMLTGKWEFSDKVLVDHSYTYVLTFKSAETGQIRYLYLTPDSVSVSEYEGGRQTEITCNDLKINFEFNGNLSILLNTGILLQTNEFTLENIGYFNK